MVTLRLPFHCDQATAFLRGTRIEMLTGLDPDHMGVAATQIREVSVGLVTRLTPETLEITLTGYVGTDLVPPPSRPFRLRTYFTALAWDQSVVDLKAGSVERRLDPTDEMDSPDPDLFQPTRFSGQLTIPRGSSVQNLQYSRRRDTSPTGGHPVPPGTSTTSQRGLASAPYPPVLGVLTGYRFSLNRDQDLDLVEFETSDAVCANGGLQWTVRADVRGSDDEPIEEIFVSATGLLLYGQSLVLDSTPGQ